MKLTFHTDFEEIKRIIRMITQIIHILIRQNRKRDYTDYGTDYTDKKTSTQKPEVCTDACQKTYSSSISLPMQILTATLLLLTIIPVLFSENIYTPQGNLLFSGQGILMYKLLDTNSTGEGSSLILRHTLLPQFQNLIIFNDVYKGITNNVYVGRFPTKLTSFTLDKYEYDGFRWDFLTKNNSLSTCVSRISNTAGQTFFTPQPPSNPLLSYNDIYMFGVRDEINLGALGMGLSIVNLNRNKGKLTTNMNPFTGQPNENPPSVIYLKFKDGSPEDPYGTKLYNVKVFVDGVLYYKFVPGRKIPDPGDNNEASFIQPANLSSSDNNSRWVDRDGYFVYGFNMPNYRNVKSVRFELTLSRDYCVEMWSNTFTRPVQALKSFGNIKDESNITTTSVYYNLDNSSTLFSVDSRFSIFDIQVSGEVATLIKESSYPNGSGEEDSRKYTSYYVKAERRLWMFLFGGEYYDIHPYYDETLYLTNNLTPSDSSWAVDASRGKPSRLDDYDPNDFSTRDKDLNSIDDYREDFLAYNTDPQEFKLGMQMDFNNNGIPDFGETTAYPIYYKERGLKGYHLFGEFDIYSGLVSTAGFINERKEIYTTSAITLYNLLRYRLPIPNFGSIRARYLIKRVRDDIPNSTVNSSDQLIFREALQNVFTFITEYKAVPNLNATSKFTLNHLDDRYGSKNTFSAVIINKIDYTFPVTPELSVIPMYRNDRFLGNSIPRTATDAIDAGKNYYILKFNYYITPKTLLGLGGEYDVFNDYIDPSNNYTRKVGSLELSTNAHYWGRNFSLILGTSLGRTEYTSGTTGGTETSLNLFITVLMM